MLSTAYIVSSTLTSQLHSSSHRGFLPKYVKHLKDLKFLREDLVVSIHSEEVTMIVVFSCLFSTKIHKASERYEVFERGFGRQ